MCALPQNQHLEFNSVTILWLETTELAYWALPINWWKHPAFTQTDLCVEYLLYLHFTSYDPQANKYRYWRNDGRIKGTLSTNGGFSFIYICQYIYIHIYPNRRRVFQVPHPSFPEGTLFVSAGLQDVDSSLGGHGGCIPHTWRYLEIFRQFWWLGIWIPGYHLVN